MDDRNVPNPASAKSKAEGERGETGGIANRPSSEEEDDDLIARNSEHARATPRRYDRHVREDS